MRSLNTQRSATIRCFFFFNDTATTEIYTLSLHDALPIYIYPDVGAIQRQFHHLVRIVPGGGRIVWNAADALLRDTLQMRSEEHTSELQSRSDLVCRLLLEKKKIYTAAQKIAIIPAVTPAQ